MIKKILFFLIIFYALSPEIHAQQGKVDNTFNTLDDGLNGDGFNGTVRTLNRQSDGNLIVGGEFVSLNGIPLSYLTRLLPDGTVDESFNTGTGFNGKIYTSYIQFDGKIILGGSFTSYNGINCGRLVRLNTDGSYDATFNTSIGATTGIIYGIDQYSDGRIIIAGSFTKYNNVNVPRIACILPNGALDNSFITGTGVSVITNVKILSNEKIVIGGSFTKFDNVLANRFARLNSNGTIDTTFDIGIGFDDDVNALVVQPDGKIIVGGNFTSFNGLTANRIIRINENGTADTSFLSGAGIDKGTVEIIKNDAAGNIMVGGSFTGVYNGTKVNRVFLLYENGILNTDFDIGGGPGGASVFALENDTDGSWYIGGSFAAFDGQNQGRLAKVSAEGEHDISYLAAGIGFDNSVLKILPLPDLKAMVFGNFSKFNNGFAPRIIRLLENGMSDPDFNSGKSGANKVIRTAILQPEDGKIIMGGDFTIYNGIVCNRMVRILPDGAIDNSFNMGTAFNGAVYAIAIYPDNKVIIAGNFTSYNGENGLGRIVRLLPDGSRDTSFNVGLGANTYIDAILIQPDGKILVAGRFTSFNGNLSSAHLVRLNYDGSIDSGFSIGTGFDKNVYALAVQSDNKIIVGGNFTSYNGISQKRILRLNTNGSLDTTFESGNGFSNGEVRSILTQPDDRILVGGTFSGNYNGSPSLRLLRLLKTGSFDSSFNAPLNNKLFAMSFTADYRLLVGGNFNSVSGISKHRVARLKLCLQSTTWNGTAWSNGLPSGGKDVFFKDNFESLTSANICSCTIDQGKTVTLLEGNNLGIEFSYSGSGTLILEDNASLYQSDDDMVNTGIIHFKRKTKPVSRYDYTYWSSPVQNQKLIDVFPTTLSDKYHSYDILLQSWHYEDTSNTMITGKGYSIRAPQEYSITERSVFEAIFKGIPNNGKVEVDLGNTDSFNLIGNPYPSAVDADVFLNKNALKTQGALYFWTHNTPASNLKYNADDYATYNLVGGVGTRATADGLNTTEPDGTIAAGQAFFIQSKNLGTAEFNDEMRIAGRNSNFFKPGKKENITNKSALKKHRIWLNLQNNEGLFKQILIGYVRGATNSFDEDYDAISLDGNQFVDFYSLVENKDLVIQGRALPFEETDSIALGYKSTIDGNYNVSIDHQDGIFNGLDIFIEDKDLKTIQNLKDASYNFNSAKGIFNDRFVLRFTNKTLETNDFEANQDLVLLSVKNKIIGVEAFNENIAEIKVFDISGKQIYTKNKIGTTKIELQNVSSSHQVLVVKVTLESDKKVTRKIIF